MSSINGFSSGIPLPQFDTSRTVKDTFNKATNDVDPGFHSGFGQRGAGREIGFADEYNTAKYDANDLDPGFNAGFGQRGARSEIDAGGPYKKAGHGAGELDSGFNAGFSRRRSWA
ncbi:hypothetical protein [Pseudomonas salomonii]|uniref:Uncharacterized protein n=1 Tax=Pseudomonas salomonii TaxID=191391 RepID=A0A1H3SH62_9PSED|nr:hypothetical protein [Pseudomonas salomonii]NWF07393.1 hypothetical protein [Pseudomonas salomonii]SDZ37302.1 hypothetical protein SAMN05216247_109187 [Pseudomonas salomonii]